MTTADPAPDTRLEPVAFLEGRWVSRDGDKYTEERWSPPQGGKMVGSGRTVTGTTTVHTERLVIEWTEDGIDYVADPEGQKRTRFRMVEAAEGRVVFANPAHDFPQRIIYVHRRGQLTAEIQGKREDGTMRSFRWVFVPDR